MESRILKTKQRAIRAALREAERRLLADGEVCLHLYATLGLVSVLEANGRKKEVVARYGWATGKS